MKTIAIIAAFAAASSTVAAGEAVRAEGGFELRLSEEGGVRTIGVSGSDGRLAVARGADTLDILPAADAQAAWKAFAMPEAPDAIEWSGDEAGDAEDVVLRRTIKKKDDGAEPRNVEKRVIVRKREGGEDIRIEGGDALDLDDDDIAFIEDLGDGAKVRKVIRIEKSGEAGAESDRRRLIRIDGAKAKDAARFIDEAKGLDASERAAMKTAVGI